MNYNHKNVFTRFCALLLAVVTSLLLCVPAFAAYGSTPTYATGNYSYNSSTSYESSTSSADWFTAVLAQLRTMYSFMFSKLNAINTAVGFCQSYLSEMRDNTKKLITMDVNIKSIYDKLNLDINPAVSSIKNDASSIKTLVDTSNTYTSNIYSQVLKLATEVTAAKILTAVQSISTDGLATEATLSDLNSKVATDSHISDIYEQYKSLVSDTMDGNDVVTITPAEHFRRFDRSLDRIAPNSYSAYSVFVNARDGAWSNGKVTMTTVTGFRFGLNRSKKYDLNQTSLRDYSLYSFLLNRLDNLVLMNYRLVDQLADAEDEKLKDATEDRRTTITDYIKSDGTNEKYVDSLGLAQTVTGGLETGVSMSDANTFVDGILNGDESSDYWSWFTQATADDLDKASSASSARLAPRSPAQSTYWVIHPGATADDYVNEWRNNSG